MGRPVATPRTVLLAALGLHLAASSVHGLSHGLVPVELAPWQVATVAATTFVGPVVGAALVLAGRRYGLPLFTASMAGALAFGVAFHFVVPNPDHVHAVPADPWRLPFRASAVGVALANAVGVAAGAYVRRRTPEDANTTSAVEPSNR